jgi:hypothetical protein
MEHLRSVDVPGEDRYKTSRKILAPDHIARSTEGEVGRPHASSLDALMETEESNVGVHGSPARFIDDLLEVPPNLVPNKGKPGEGQAILAHLQQKRSGPVENIEIRVLGEKAERYLGTFMVPGNEQNRDPPRSDLLQRG